jgi:RHS repeat-associated protein
MEMPGRKYNPQGYRYGFNGKENDRSGEWGLGLVQDYGFRLYNPGLGRFLSVDPLTESYPELTPYQFASNTPIWAIDLDGLEARIYTECALVPHSYISVIDADNLIHVFTFGQYGQNFSDHTNFPIAGQLDNMYNKGALVHLVGKDANDYIFHTFQYNLKVQEVKDVDKVLRYFANEMNGLPPARKEEPHAPMYDRLGDSESVAFNNYILTPWIDLPFFRGENCTSVAKKGLWEGLTTLDKIISALPFSLGLPIPQVFRSTLAGLGVQDVTRNEFLRVNECENELNESACPTIECEFPKSLSNEYHWKNSSPAPQTELKKSEN